MEIDISGTWQCLKELGCWVTYKLLAEPMHARRYQFLFNSDFSGNLGVVETSDVENFECSDHKGMIVGRE